MNMRIIFPVIFYLLIAILSGCASIKESAKGFAGVSTQVLEDKRKDALKKSFAYGYNDCYAKVKDILKEADVGAYIYSEDLKKKLIAVYLSPADTTPVGIFFTENAGTDTLIEISSPSIYAKEEIANKIFSRIDKLMKTKPAQEIKTNVKEEAGN